LKKNILDQNIAYLKNDDFEGFLYAIKNGKMRSNIRNKRYFRVQRTKINNLSALEHNYKTFVTDFMLILLNITKICIKNLFFPLF
jgi:hypothetical protein